MGFYCRFNTIEFNSALFIKASSCHGATGFLLLQEKAFHIITRAERKQIKGNSRLLADSSQSIHDMLLSGLPKITSTYYHITPSLLTLYEELKPRFIFLSLNLSCAYFVYYVWQEEIPLKK